MRGWNAASSTASLQWGVARDLVTGPGDGRRGMGTVATQPLSKPAQARHEQVMMRAATTMPPAEARGAVTTAKYAPVLQLRRRIALLLTDLNGGGVQKMTVSLAGALAERGHEAVIVLYSARGVLNSHIPPNVALHHLKAGSRVTARLAPIWADPLALPRLLLPVLLPRKPPPGLKYLPVAGTIPGSVSARRADLRGSQLQPRRRLGQPARGRARQGRDQRTHGAIEDADEIGQLADKVSARPDAPHLSAGRRDRRCLHGPWAMIWPMLRAFHARGSSRSTIRWWAPISPRWPGSPSIIHGSSWAHRP